MGGRGRPRLPAGAAKFIEQVDDAGHGPVQVDRLHELLPGAGTAKDVAPALQKEARAARREALVAGAAQHTVGPGAHRQYEVTVQVRQGPHPMWARVPIPAERLDPGPPKSLFGLWADGQRTNTRTLHSMLSTTSGFHGHTAHTAVPKGTLVEALRGGDDVRWALHSTEEQLTRTGEVAIDLRVDVDTGPFTSSTVMRV